MSASGYEIEPNVSRFRTWKVPCVRLSYNVESSWTTSRISADDAPAVASGNQPILELRMCRARTLLCEDRDLVQSSRVRRRHPGLQVGNVRILAREVQ